MTGYAHICYSVSDNCINPGSYGMICCHCNACGRVNKDTMLYDRLRLYEECLRNAIEFDQWDEHSERARKIQDENKKKKIKYYEEKIAETKHLLKQEV